MKRGAWLAAALVLAACATAQQPAQPVGTAMPTAMPVMVTPKPPPTATPTPLATPTPRPSPTTLGPHGLPSSTFLTGKWGGNDYELDFTQDGNAVEAGGRHFYNGVRFTGTVVGGVLELSGTESSDVQPSSPSGASLHLVYHPEDDTLQGGNVTLRRAKAAT